MKAYSIATAVIVVCLGTDILAQNYIRLSRYDPNLVASKRNYIRLSRQDPTFAVAHKEELVAREEGVKSNAPKRNYIRLSRQGPNFVVDPKEQLVGREEGVKPKAPKTNLPIAPFWEKGTFEHPISLQNENGGYPHDVIQMPFPKFQRRANYVRLAKKANYVRLAKKNTDFDGASHFYDDVQYGEN